MKNFITSLFSAFLFITINVFAQSPLYLDPNAAVEERVKDLLERMTLEEKIGQMIQVDHLRLYQNRDHLSRYFIGSVLSGGSSECGDNSPLAWANMYDSLQQAALQTRLKIPMIYGIDAVHGHNNVVGATIFPHNIGLGCTHNPELVKQVAEITAAEVAATGMDWTFAPCIAVPRDEHWGRFYEGFGEDPGLVSKMGVAQVNGFQGEKLNGRTSILACPKHYIGDGGTKGGDDQGNTIADEETIRKLYLPAYKAAVDAGAATVMASYSSINGLKMHANKYWLTDVLKGELGFKGFVVSDWSGIDQLNKDYKQAVAMAINAGIDMGMLPRKYVEFFDDLKSLVDEGVVPVSRIDDAVTRILRIKFEMGIFEHPFTDRSLLPLVGSKEHREVARRAVRESLVLLKNENNAFPLPKENSRILLAGSHADNLGYQCGGWTIAWMGDSGNVTKGTTILQAMKNAAPSSEISFSLTGEPGSLKPDYSVVVIGEKPYAEGRGDSLDIVVTDKDAAMIKKLKSEGSKVIVILISGRPMIIDKIINDADAVIAAWLPGTEGEGIADILFGDYKPSGKLSHSWPRSMKQVPVNAGDDNYDPLFKMGYGLE